MSSLLYQTIEQISRGKGIDPDVIIGAVEDAIVTATKKYYRTEEDLRARLNRETGNVEVFILKTVVDSVITPDTEISLREAKHAQPGAKVGQEIEVQKPTAALGRIAAQTAKQVIFQKVREAERDNIFSEFGDRIAELLTGIVKRAENGDLVVDLGRTEAVLPRREQSRAEVFNAGERIRVVIVRVLRTSRGPQVVVSRTDPALLTRLFEMEVPEIYEGTVVVKNAVREPGDRAKVAVYSKRQGCGSGGSLRRYQGFARPEHHPRAARGENRYRTVERRSLHVREQRAQPSQGEPRVHCPRKRKDHGGYRRGQAALFGDREKRTKRPLGGQAHRLANRHQE